VAALGDDVEGSQESLVRQRLRAGQIVFEFRYGYADRGSQFLLGGNDLQRCEQRTPMCTVHCPRRSKKYPGSVKLSRAPVCR